MSINQRIKTIRKKNKLNQSEMANKINISQGALSELESEKNKPSIDTIVTICKEFPNVDPKWLILGEETTEQDKMSFYEFKEESNKLFKEKNLSEDEIKEVLLKALEIANLLNKKD